MDSYEFRAAKGTVLQSNINCLLMLVPTNIKLEGDMDVQCTKATLCLSGIIGCLAENALSIKPALSKFA